ncbi:hypothetical protein [Granulicella rosea]|uniref:hypothetical protein n=1 Tax=Granulicella rosea TaxID=474952 RepID=UPI00115E50F1|nr:hypothetical protein [Granulicella rosea]
MPAKISDCNEHRKRIHRHIYWISAAIASATFLLCAYVSLVPGMFPEDQFLLISLAGIFLITALGIGGWGLTVRRPPIAVWPAGPIVGVLLLLELIQCVNGLFEVSTKKFH